MGNKEIGCFITINSYTGTISFNSNAAKVLDLENVLLSFFQDVTEKSIWYIKPSYSEGDFKVRVSPLIYKDKIHLTFQLCSVFVVRRIISSINLRCESVRFYFDSKPHISGNFKIETSRPHIRRVGPQYFLDKYFPQPMNH